MKKNIDTVVDDTENEFIMQEKTELGEIMDNLDSDMVDEKNKMSSVDFNARLTKQEANACLIFDELMRLEIFPDNLGLSRQKKRLSVSLDGKGRDEKVRIVQGEREHKTGGGLGKGIMNLFSRQ